MGIESRGVRSVVRRAGLCTCVRAERERVGDDDVVGKAR
jgi:hypothetical protein